MKKINYLLSTLILSSAIILAPTLLKNEIVHAESPGASRIEKNEGSSGTFGTVNWNISSDGVLHISSGEFASTKGKNPWAEYNSQIKAIVFDGKVIANVDSSGLFKGMHQMTKIDNLKNLETSKVTNMSRMFLDDWNLKSLDLSGFKTSNVTDMSYLFTNLAALTSIDVNNLDTSKVTNMSQMFSTLKSITDLELTHFDTSNVTDMSKMFSGDTQLGNLVLTSFNTSKVTNMSGMFAGVALSNFDLNLNLKKINTSQVTDMSSMFATCPYIYNLDLSHFDTRKLTKMDKIFYGDYRLTNLNLSSFDTSQVSSMSQAFANTALDQIKLGSKTLLNDTVSLGIPVGYGDKYTGKWQNIGTGNISVPNGKWSGSSSELIAKSATGIADTYILLRNHDFSINAKDFTVEKSKVIGLDLIKASQAQVKDSLDLDTQAKVAVINRGGLTNKVGTYNITLGIKDISGIAKTVLVKVVKDTTPIPPVVKYQSVYRLYNKNTGEHFYTESSFERESLVKNGWNNEGTGWLAPSTGSSIYRVYNPNAKGGDHYYTASKYEAVSLVKTGWKWDNLGKPVFYSGGKLPVYVAFNPNATISGSHNYTSNVFEQKSLLRNGWKFGKIQFYGNKF